LLVFLRGPAWLGVAVVAVVLALALVEFFSLLEARRIRPMRLVGGLLAAALFLDVAYPGRFPLPFVPLGLLLLLILMLGRASDPGAVPAAAGTLLGAAYVGGLGGAIGALRVLPPSPEGSWRLVLLLAIVMVSDTLAFFVGHAVGRHRLAPAVSPGKSVEGALGGVVGGMIGAVVVRQLGLPHVPLAHALVLGAAVAAMGVVGDLDESLLKRWAGVKDSGALLPGHGGMLDRIDGLLFGAPVLYYYFQYVH
jgi:phosphatidate cytidylyltransferase